MAYGSFILAKQAGFDIRFADGNYEIPKSDVYMLPSVCGDACPKRTWNELLKRVYNDGAVLYISYNDAFLSEFAKVTGVKVMGNKERTFDSVIEITEINKKMRIFGERKLALESVGAEVLAREADGNPALTVNNYGKGKIYFLNFAPELHLVDRVDAFSDTENEFYKLYEYIFKNYISTAIKSKSSPFIGLTEHKISETTVAVTAINYSSEKIDFSIELENGYSLGGENTLSLSLGAGDMSILKLNRTKI